MFADDLAFICKDIDEATRGIECMENWAFENNFVLNKKKSGVMPLVKKKARNKIIG
jgi:hypothetical protein